MVIYFSYDIDPLLACPCCGDRGMIDSFLDDLNALRHEFGKPMIVSSGYRCRRYNEKMVYTQTHSSGKAVDIKITNPDAHELTKLAFKHGFMGIGWNQKGDREKRFIHLDKARNKPAIWSY